MVLKIGQNGKVGRNYKRVSLFIQIFQNIQVTAISRIFQWIWVLRNLWQRLLNCSKINLGLLIKIRWFNLLVLTAMSPHLTVSSSLKWALTSMLQAWLVQISLKSLVFQLIKWNRYLNMRYWWTSSNSSSAFVMELEYCSWNWWFPNISIRNNWKKDS